MDTVNQYVLMEIFEYLDGTALKNCAETCKSWSQLIGSNISAMKKLPLVIDTERIGENNEHMKDIKRLKRVYHTLLIEAKRVTCKIVASLKIHSNFIRVLELIDVDCTEASWKALLRNLCIIEKITIVESKLSGIKKSTKDEKINIPSLKSLVVVDSDWIYFGCIGETEIEELKIHNRHFYSSDGEHFLAFLKQQKHISSMGIRVQNIAFYKALINDANNTFKFHLNKLAISYRYFSDMTHAQIVLDFFEQHKETLEILEADCKLNDKIYEYIFTKLQLKSLMLHATFLPKEALVFYNSLRQNTHLKKLVLTGEFNSHIPAQGLFSIYRNIEDLSIHNWSLTTGNDILVSIISSLPKISQLKIPFLAESTELPIPSLKQLSIESVNSKVDFQSLILNQNSIEKLCVKWIHEDINDVMEYAAPNLKNLKHAVFGPGFKPTIHTLKAFKQNCTNLHTLEIFEDQNRPITGDVLSEINGNGLRVYQYKNQAASKIFSVEKSMWHEEDTFYIHLSSHSNSATDSMDDDSDSMDDDDDDDFNFYDSDSSYGHGYYDSDEGMDFEDYMLREVIGFLIN